MLLFSFFKKSFTCTFLFNSISQSQSDLQKKSVLCFLSDRQETELETRDGPKVRQLPGGRDKASFNFSRLAIQRRSEDVPLLLPLGEIKFSQDSFYIKHLINANGMFTKKFCLEVAHNATQVYLHIYYALLDE